MKTQAEVYLFLLKTAKDLHKDSHNIKQLPKILQDFRNEAGRLPLINLDKYSYYNKVSEQVLSLQTSKPELYNSLNELLTSYPQVSGGMSGDHISYENVTYNEDMLSLTGRFIDCWNNTSNS